MDLNNLYWFVKVVDLGSMTKAAKYSNCAVSSISDRIKQLEQSLNLRLLERSTRQLRLTEAGEMFYERAHMIVESAEQAKLAMESWHEEPAGLLTISAPPELTRSALLPALRLMEDRHPKVKIRLLLSSERSDLLRENIDVAIRVGELENSQLIARKLTNMSLRLVASENYLKTHNSIHHPNDLAQHACIPLVSLINYKVWPWLFSKDSESVTIIPKGNVEVSSVGSGLDLALAGMGIALVSNLLLTDHAQMGLTSILPDWQLPQAPVWAVYPSKSNLSPKVRALIDVLEETLM